MTTSATIVTQLISTTWTKRSRGSPLAALRNRVPERLVLPLPPQPKKGPRAAHIVHRVAYGEINNFAAPRVNKVEEYQGMHSPPTRAVGLHLAGDVLRVMFEGPYAYEADVPAVIPARMGAPGRTVPRSPFSLAPGQWGQIRYMGRLMYYYDNVTYYEKWVCNIAWAHDLSPRVFVETQPDHIYVSMPDVW